jgi:AcrR family transcriptional regulator
MAAIERGGESAVRVLEVARQAGFSVRMIYYFFGDREGLIEAARARQFIGRGLEDVAAIAQLVDSSPDAQAFSAGVKRIVAAGFQGPRTEQRLSRASVIGATWKRPRLAAVIQAEQLKVLTALEAVVERAQGRGFIDPNVPARAFAAFMQAYSFGKVMADLAGPGVVPDEDWTAVVVRFISAFAPPTPQPPGPTPTPR